MGTWQREPGKIDFVMSGELTSSSEAIGPPRQTSDEVTQWTHREAVPWNGNFYPLLGSIFLVVGLVALITGKGYLAVFAGAAIAAICWREWLPVSYQVDQDGIRQTVLRMSRFKPWALITSVQFHRNAMELQMRPLKWKKRSERPIWIPMGEQHLEIRERLRTLVPHLIWDDPDDDSKIPLPEK